MCKVTYRDANCVHPLKSAYSSFKMRTEEKNYVFNMSSSSRSTFIAAYVFFCMFRKRTREGASNTNIRKKINSIRIQLGTS